MKPNIHKLSGRYCPHCLSALWQVISSGLEFCPSDPVCDYEVRPEGAQPFNKLQVKARQLNAKRLEVDALHNRLRSALEEKAAMESDPDWIQFVELAAEQLNLPPLAPFQKALPALLSQPPGAPSRRGGQTSGMPEHEKRSVADGLHPDVNAAYSYVISVSDTCDIPSLNAWHGWALREAFLAGVSLAESRPTSSEAQPPKFVVEQFHDDEGWIEISGCSFTTKELAVAELEHREQHHQQRDLQVVKVGVVTETVSREVRELVEVGLPGVAQPFRTWVKEAGE